MKYRDVLKRLEADETQRSADWHRLGEAFFAMEIIAVTLFAILIPDLALSWRQFTTRRT